MVGYLIGIMLPLALCAGSFISRMAGRLLHDASATSPHHLLTVALCAIIWVSITLRYGMSLGTPELLILMSLLLCLSITDIEALIIPNACIGLGIVNRLTFVLIGELVGGFQFMEFLSVCGAVIIGGLCVALPLLLLTLLAEKMTAKTMMGGGDLKLFFMIALYFTWETNLLLIILACAIGVACGLIAMRNGCAENRSFPFGPSISLATWITILCGPMAIDWYTSLL